MKTMIGIAVLSAFALPMFSLPQAREKAAAGSSAAGIIEGVLQSGTAEDAVRKFRELRSALGGKVEFKESEFNTLGYRMIRQGRMADAARIFEMNVELFPASADVYESLCEGYLYLGNRDKAEEALKAALRRGNADESFIGQLSRALRDLETLDWQIRSETRAVVRFQPGQATGLRGPYLGQDPPGDEPKVFAPGIVSALGHNDFGASFSPDGKEFYFNRGMTIMVCRLEKDSWTAPAPAAFNGGFRSHLAHLAFDNRRLFFGGTRPPQPYGIWLTERTAGGWSEPRRMWDGMYASSAENGNIYFGMEGASGANIVRTRLVDGRYAEPETQAVKSTGPNSKLPHLFHPGIAPDESYLVFDDNKALYVSFRERDGSWGPALSLTGALKAKQATIASISPDGRFLFFASHLDLNWVSTQILERLKQK